MKRYSLGDLLRYKAQVQQPRRVVLCGSTRFMWAFREANLRETLLGNIVLTIGCDTKSDSGLNLTEQDKFNLDLLHLHKIDLADEVFVLNVGGYIGSSTRRELVYALRSGKPVFFYARYQDAPEYPYVPVFLHCLVCDGIAFYEPFQVPGLCQAAELPCGHKVKEACVYPYVARYEL